MIDQSRKLVEKWAPVLNADGVPKITDNYRLAATAQLLENQEKAIQEERVGGNELLSETVTNNVVGGSAVGGAGNIANWDPVLISLVRRSAPNMIGFDIAGVQPMTGPVGLVFAMKSRYVDGSPAALSTDSTEALFNEADSDFSGTGTHAGDPSTLPTADNVYTSDSPAGWSNTDDATLDGVGDAGGTDPFGSGYTTAVAETLTGKEGLPTNAENYLREMGFTIERTAVTAKSRALRATYSVEMVQDLRAIHGLDAESELSNILTTEILAEINREVIRTVNVKAKLGAQQGGLTNVANGGPGGVFDLASDADGRWSIEKYRGLLMQMEREANVIAKETRRGRGNFVLVSSDVASALNAAGILAYDTNNQGAGLAVDDTGSTYAGMIGGRIKVYIDPYAGLDYMTMGYKGASPMDSGMFYCPYVPMTPYKAVDQDSYQPSIAFKTRYGLISSPFAEETPQNGIGNNRSNVYYRIMRVKNILA